jgi:hypothetical protein
MFDDVHLWFMFSNCRRTAVLCLPFRRVRCEIYKNTPISFAMTVRPYVSTPEPVNFHNCAKIFTGKLC